MKNSLNPILCWRVNEVLKTCPRMRFQSAICVSLANFVREKVAGGSLSQVENERFGRKSLKKQKPVKTRRPKNLCFKNLSKNYAL